MVKKRNQIITLILTIILCTVFTYTPSSAYVKLNNQESTVKYIDNCIRNYEKKVTFISDEAEIDLNELYDSGICQLYPKITYDDGVYVYDINIEYWASRKECKRYYEVLDGIGYWLEGRTDAEKVEKLRWWIRKHITYGDNDEYDTACDAVNTGKAMCGGYAGVFRAFGRSVGLDVKTVTGGISDGEGHAWNIVCLDGRWLGVDTCWDEVTYDLDDWEGHDVVTTY